MTDFKKLKVVELRAELASRNLIQTGKRDELIERLEEFEFQHAEPSQDEDMPQATESHEMEADHDVLEDQEIEIEDDQAQNIITKTETAEKDAQKIELSPIVPPTQSTPETAATDLEALEEEKRRLRALRFSLNESEFAQVNIDVTIKRLNHALPNRSHHRGIKKHSRQRHSINK